MKPLLSVSVVVAASSQALAGPGLTLDKGTVNATLTVENDVSAGHFGDTTSFAPDIAAGLTKNLTVALIHSSYGRTGSRSGTGNGICTSAACAHTYDNAGVEGRYSLRNGTLAIAIDGGVYGTSFDRDDYAAKAGAVLRYKVERISLQFLPSLAIALTNRDAEVVNHDRVFLPVSALYAVGGGFSVGVAAAAKAPLDGVKDNYEGGAGVSASYSMSPAVGFGTSWSFARMFGGDVAMDNPHGLDARTLQFWVSVTK